MKIFVNASTTVIGGGAQVAASFIVNSISDAENEFIYAVSPLVYEHLQDFRKLPNLHLVTPSPARIHHGRNSRELLKQMENAFRPEVIFTIFGPAYVKFNATHICGIGDGWLTHRNTWSMKVLQTHEKFIKILRLLYKKYRLSKSDFYWTEARVSQLGLSKLLNISESRIAVIPNSFSAFHLTSTVQNRNPKKTINIFTLAAPYPHKNLLIIPEVAALIKQEYLGSNDYKFIVTIPAGTPECRKFEKLVKKLNVEHMIQNKGIISQVAVPETYSEIDILFLPTLLETFSVTYLEAMYFKRAIVTSDIDFAHNICGDAAEYFRPLDAQSAMKALLNVSEHHERYKQLVKNGIIQLKKYPASHEKYEMHINWIHQVSRL
jgi:glycosyltransferase involved in cell wall biosynthesis